METRTLEERVIDLLYAIPEIKELTSNPSIFSDDIEGHDCDKCPAGEYNQGDTFDPDVCMDCWTQAIKRAFETENGPRMSYCSKDDVAGIIGKTQEEDIEDTIAQADITIEEALEPKLKEMRNWI